MIKRNIPAILALISGIILIIILSGPLGPLPALGTLLNPASGYLVNRESSLDLSDQTLPPILTKDSAQVVMDSLLIPHIYVQNDEDAYRIQGFLMGKYRLWQMDFITRVAAGRLSEVVGPRALAFDKRQRRKGLAAAAEMAEEAWKKFPISYGYLEAFSEGVNSYIRSLSWSSYPIEYKLLNYHPEPWSPYKSALFVKHMSDVLCGKEKDFEMTNAYAILGDSLFNMLYPERIQVSPPVIPDEKVFDFKQNNTLVPTGVINSGPDLGFHQRPNEKKAAGLGSNNWAVKAYKTASKSTILANDPHLPLTLPSIWYMIHIHTPEYNTMGVAFPGMPGVILGFNEDIAWGITNSGQDVLDWLKVEWDSTRSTYQWGEETRRIIWRKEFISIKGTKPVIDSVPWTDFGPIRRIETFDGPQYAIMRWLGHVRPETDEVSVFVNINRASDYEDFLNAIKNFNSPPQNFLFASKDNDIAIHVQGRFPFRHAKFGRFLETAHPQDTWHAFLPDAHLPRIANPDQGYLASANQVSTDSSYPYYYIDGDFRPTRAKVINEYLERSNDLTMEDMKALQMNNYDSETHALILAALKHLSLNDPLRTALQNWDGRFDADCELCTLAEIWKNELHSTIYDELVVQRPVDVDLPSTWTTIELLDSFPDHVIMDIKNTDIIEDADQVVDSSFKSAVDIFDSFDDKQWYKFRNTEISHIIPSLTSFGHYEIKAGGTGTAPNALRQDKGPSWRMIVDLGDKVKALGVYPGGQSGNTGSRYYDNLLPAWISGDYYPLELFDSPEEIPEKLFIMKSIH